MVDMNHANPFDGGANYINPPSWQGVLRQVSHLAQFSGGLQVIDGGVGAGKTVFAHMLANTLPAEVANDVLALPAGLPTAQVFDCLLTALGLDVQQGQSVGQSIVALRQFNNQLKQEQERKILIIDDAHHLDDQALAALASVFQGDNDAEVGLAVVFLSIRGLAQRLDKLNLVDVEVRDCILPSFSATEAEDLLGQEFAAVAGEGQRFPFDDDFVAALWREANGNPRELLRLAHDAWEDLRQESTPLWQRIPVWHAVAIFALIVVLAVGVVTYSAKKEAAQPLPPAVITTKITPSALPAVEQSPVVESPVTIVDTAIHSEDSQPTESLAQSSVESLASETSMVVTTEVSEVITSAMDTENSVPSPVVYTVPPSEGVDVSSAINSAPKAPAVNQAPVPPTPPKIINRPIEGLTSDEAALMSMADRGFAIQISASNSLKSLESFVAEQRNRSTLKIYRSIRSGKNWYIVVEGFYADKDSALASMKNLPTHQLKAGPWPKSISAIKLEIEAYKQQAR
ncbi:MAG: AAA family ATPase [Marinagarivorans sp.]|nr:AAA family ATPase [Marinagarivorans sp.]